MKKALFFIAAIGTLTLGGCTKFKPSEKDPLWYVYHGDKVGLIAEGRIKFTYRSVKYIDNVVAPDCPFSYGRFNPELFNKSLLKSPVDMHSLPWIPWIYDSIDFESFGDWNLIRCRLGKDTYYYNNDLYAQAGRQPVTKIEALGNLYRGMNAFCKKAEYKFHTAQGVYSSIVGPFQDFWIGINGYAFKKDGKWGWMSGRSDENKAQYTELLPAQYDAVIEVIDLAKKFGPSLKSYVILTRQGNHWQAFDYQGKPISTNQALVEDLLKTKPEPPQDLYPYGNYVRIKCRRCGDRTTGLIVTYM